MTVFKLNDKDITEAIQIYLHLQGFELKELTRKRGSDHFGVSNTHYEAHAVRAEKYKLVKESEVKRIRSFFEKQNMNKRK